MASVDTISYWKMRTLLAVVTTLFLIGAFVQLTTWHDPPVTGSCEDERATGRSVLTSDQRGATGIFECDNSARASSSLGSWVPFQDAVSRTFSVQVPESTMRSCVINVAIPGMYEKTVETVTTNFSKIAIADSGFTYDAGKPELPIIRGLVEIPAGKRVNVQIIAADCRDLFGYNIYPSQGIMLETTPNPATERLQLDGEFYSTDTYYPNQLISVSPSVKLRGHTVVQLSINAFRYNPARRLLRVCAQVEFQLNYIDDGETTEAYPRKLISPAFEDLCSKTIWNHGSLGDQASTSPTMGYLIISHDIFYPHLISFEEWKRTLGLNVTSVRLSDIGANATDVDIFNFVRNAFYNWTLPPTYLLLVGDTEYVPTHYGTISQSWPKVGVPTDHNFSCVYGDDYFPDLFVGRLSVRTIQELNYTLSKIMNYQGFFNPKATLISGAGYEEEYCDQFWYLLAHEDYFVERLYENFGNATILEIWNAVNEGRSIVLYCDHGSEDQWDTSEFSNLHVSRLQTVSEHQYPIVLSCACLTGNYDYESDCLGEAWMKAQNKGAVAFLGSSCIASAPHSNEIFIGFFLGIFDDRLDEFGPLTARGKLHMFNLHGDNYYTQLHFDLYNILTDPQLDLYPYRTREVPTEFPTIQGAIDHAKSGETILVQEGTYNEHIVINKTLKLAGEGASLTHILSSDSNVTVQITADNVELSGFTLRAEWSTASCGINVSSNGNRITCNTIANNSYGIVLANSSANALFHNNLIYNTHQVHLLNTLDSTWDNGCEGNYWSNYNGTDIDRDGVGDTYLSWEGVDNYPLMNPYWSPGDIDHDMDVDIFDLVKAASAYGCTPSSPKWNPHCDVAEPFEKIDIFDIITIAGSYGKKG
jgi:parallel beta-helix repeat protein